MIDGSKEPVTSVLSGMDGACGSELFLKEKGLCGNGIYGYRFPYGSTGLIALGEGYYYISHDHGKNGEYSSEIFLYRYTGREDGPFEPVIKGE